MPERDIEKTPFIAFYENSFRGIMFQWLIAAMLTWIFLYNGVKWVYPISWFTLIIGFNGIRVFCLKYFYKNERYKQHQAGMVALFTALLFILGVIWGGAYTFLFPHAHTLREGIVILTLGGMALGGIPSLAPYLIVYLAFILPMLLPIIFTQMLAMTVDYTVFSSMLLTFIAMLLVTAFHFHKLMMRTLGLDATQKELVKQLSASNQELTEANAIIQKISRTDSLTDLPNRRFFDETLAKEWRRAHRNQYEMSLLSIDVDNFKIINDSFGHLKGDEYLKNIGELMQTKLRRPGDFLARIGGDEFAIILANTPLNRAKDLANECRTAIAEYNQKTYPNKNISISIGISSNVKQSTLHALINDADKCLYEAKSLGKNRVCWNHS